jgi:ketosteroid isomerase-like protein
VTEPATGERTDEEALLRRLYELLDAGDVDAAAALADPEVDWANVWTEGRAQGREAMREHLIWIRENFGVERSVRSIERLDDGRYRVELDQTVENHGGMLLSHGPVIHLYELADGRIVRMDLG